jgi:hypothetical protein
MAPHRKKARAKRPFVPATLIASVLAGTAALTPAALKQLRNVLNRVTERMQLHIGLHKSTEKNVEQASQQAVLRLANEPGKLILLQRYARMTERAIRLKLDRLR